MSAAYVLASLSKQSAAEQRVLWLRPKAASVSGPSICDQTTSQQNFTSSVGIATRVPSCTPQREQHGRGVVPSAAQLGEAECALAPPCAHDHIDRKSVVSGKSVSVRVDL